MKDNYHGIRKMNHIDASLQKSQITPEDSKPKTCLLRLGRSSYTCDIKKLQESKFSINYRVVNYIDSGWYSKIYEVQDNRDLTTHWAIKAIDRDKPEGCQFQRDVQNLTKVKNEPSVIQIRESFDLGKTGIIVVELADADMMWRATIFNNVKTDRQFRILAKQLIEGVETLDRHCLFHPSIDMFDFLYVRKEGRVKVSALERATEKEHVTNIKALNTVLRALMPIAGRIELSENSKELLKRLSSPLSTANDLLKTEACTSIPINSRLDL